MIRHLPNLLTCCNLLCGCFGILNLFDTNATGLNLPGSPLMTTAYFVWAACVFDFLDGFAARALNVSSPIGKELDSLADVVSFGLLPSFFMYHFLWTAQNSSDAPEFIPFIALIIVVFSALRLAIFNVDETQRDSFRGLPTPANAIFLTSLPFLYFPAARFLFSIAGLVSITLVFSLLLVSRVELFALKFKNFSWRDNKLRFTFLLLSVLLLLSFQLAGLSLVIILYILLSLADRAFRGQRN